MTPHARTRTRIRTRRRGGRGGKSGRMRSIGEIPLAPCVIRDEIHTYVAVPRQWKPSAGRTGPLARGSAGPAPLRPGTGRGRDLKVNLKT